MVSFVVCAERASWQQAGRFAEKIPAPGKLELLKTCGGTPLGSRFWFT
jgi:hypothetical protein